MDSYLMKVVEYFRAPENYFWRWADSGQVIEWEGGDTICYRDELMPILKELSGEGFPSLGAILLVISACRDTHIVPVVEQTTTKTMLRLLDYYVKYPELASVKDEMNVATRFLQRIAGLPMELRSGNNRIWLLYLIFKKLDNKISEKAVTGYLDYFNSGRLDTYIFKDGFAVHKESVFSEDLYWLQKAVDTFPTVQELEMALRAGIRDLPEFVELEVPTIKPTDLLGELEEDTSTAGLAQLTKRLIAALNIPMHAHGSSDQLFGGVSDITNRGNFDRLLLSELAHDDLSLMARLANNEALYLRREELPSNPEKQRILLVDTTLKMWGLPRVFAVSAALACAHNNKAKAHIVSYALSGTGFNEISLSTKEGVVSALAQLDAALHCGRGLAQFMNQQAAREEDEVFLVTEEEITHSVLFQSILASLKKPVNFLITVSRSGDLRFYEYLKGRKKQLSEARFDLQELLFPAAKPKKEKIVKKDRTLLNAPAFMQRLPTPLFLPASKIKFNAGCFFEMKKDHLICVTIDQRVLYWNSKTLGAREIIEHLEPGQICFGSAGDNTVYILVYSGGQKYMRLYEAELDSLNIEITKITDAVSGEAKMVFDEGYFYIKGDKDLFAIEAATGKVFPGKDRIGVFTLMLERNKKAFANINLNFYKKFVNDGYTTINTVNSFYIYKDGELGFDNRRISYRKRSEPNNEMIVIENDRLEKNKFTWQHRATEREVSNLSLPNTNLKFSRFVWDDGSEVLVDPRGFLHFKSADNSIPEFTIVMIMGKPTACWAANGNTCGTSYFTGKAEGYLEATEFYYSYIKKFIDKVTEHATNAEV